MRRSFAEIIKNNKNDDGKKGLFEMSAIKEERVIYKKCPLCEAKDIIDLVVGDCSKHALYDTSLNSKIQWRQSSHCHHVLAEPTPSLCGWRRARRVQRCVRD